MKRVEVMSGKMRTWRREPLERSVMTEEVGEKNRLFYHD